MSGGQALSPSSWACQPVAPARVANLEAGGVKEPPRRAVHIPYGVLPSHGNAALGGGNGRHGLERVA